MSRKPTDLTGKKFGTLTITKYAGKIGQYPSWWCKCECGKEFTVPAYSIRQGDNFGCPFCQTHTITQSILWQGQRITILPYCKQTRMDGEQLRMLVNHLTNETEANALLIMLDRIPSEVFQSAGSEVEIPVDNEDSTDSVNSTAENWENNAIRFDKPLDK